MRAATMASRFIATSQDIDTDGSDPASRFLLHMLMAAEFERELIRERAMAGLKQYRHDYQAGKVFRRDEVVRLRDEAGTSWRAIGKKLAIPAMTALDSYQLTGHPWSD